MCRLHFYATRGRPLPNWIGRSVREGRINFTSRHQVAPHPSPFLAMSSPARARTPPCVAQVACPGGGSIPSSKTGKVIVVCKPLERPIGRGFENCVAVVPSGRPDVNNQMFVMILQKKIYFSLDHNFAVRRSLPIIMMRARLLVI